MRIFPTCPVFSTSVRRWWPCGRVATALRRATSSCATPQPSSGFVGCSRSASTSPSFYKSTVTGTKRPSADQPLTLGSWYNDKEFLFFLFVLIRTLLWHAVHRWNKCSLYVGFVRWFYEFTISAMITMLILWTCEKTMHLIFLITQYCLGDIFSWSSVLTLKFYSDFWKKF